MTWVIAVAAMLAILIFGVMAAMAIGKQQEQRRRVLQVITRGKTSSIKEESKDKALAKQRAVIARKLTEAGKEKKDHKKDNVTIRDLMIQAGVEAPTSRYWMASFAFAVVVWALAALLTSWPPIAIIFFTFAAFLGGPRFILKRMAAKRQKKFLEELPDALDGCVRLLQAGMPMTEAIAMVSREFTGPLKEEMLKIYDNQKIGVPLGQAALETAKRIPLTEVHMFATALQIQSETGSSLSEVLTNLSTVIRARFRLKRKIQALSSEAKASAGIIGSLPPLVALGLWLASPNYMEPLFETAKGHWYLVGCGMWMGCGILVMKQMINFRI
ncbi:MAG: type II secretion system F family protein [Alphaproteobacteria bacterium]